jgi:Tfp pilus assembly protein PilO
VLFFLVVLKPKLNQITDVRQKIEQERDQAQTLQNRLRQLQQAQRDEVTIRNRLSVFDRLLPQTPDLPSMIRQLQTAATASGMNLISMAPSPPSALTGAVGVQTVNVNLQVLGGFFRLQSFLTKLEDLPRVVEITSMSIAPQKDAVTQLDTLASTITFRMYVVQPNARLGGAAPTQTPSSSGG